MDRTPRRDPPVPESKPPRPADARSEASSQGRRCRPNRLLLKSSQTSSPRRFAKLDDAPQEQRQCDREPSRLALAREQVRYRRLAEALMRVCELLGASPSSEPAAAVAAAKAAASDLSEARRSASAAEGRAEELLVRLAAAEQAQDAAEQGERTARAEADELRAKLGSRRVALDAVANAEGAVVKARREASVVARRADDEARRARTWKDRALAASAVATAAVANVDDLNRRLRVIAAARDDDKRRWTSTGERDVTIALFVDCMLALRTANADRALYRLAAALRPHRAALLECAFRRLATTRRKRPIALTPLSWTYATPFAYGD